MFSSNLISKAARSTCFFRRGDLPFENDHEVDVRVRVGISPRLRPVEDQSGEAISVQLTKPLPSIQQRLAHLGGTESVSRKGIAGPGLQATEKGRYKGSVERRSPVHLVLAEPAEQGNVCLYHAVVKGRPVDGPAASAPRMLSEFDGAGKATLVRLVLNLIETDSGLSSA